MGAFPSSQPTQAWSRVSLPPSQAGTRRSAACTVCLARCPARAGAAFALLLLMAFSAPSWRTYLGPATNLEPALRPALSCPALPCPHAHPASPSLPRRSERRRASIKTQPKKHSTFPHPRAYCPAYSCCTPNSFTSHKSGATSLHLQHTPLLHSHSYPSLLTGLRNPDLTPTAFSPRHTGSRPSQNFLSALSRSAHCTFNHKESRCMPAP